MDVETVYAIHTFRAEHDDELNFQCGDPIIVLERDEMYGDGWWQGQNIHGQIGLFPMNYTSYNKPSPLSPSKITNNSTISDDVKRTETPTNTINDIQSKLYKLVTKKKSESKLNNLSITHNFSDSNISKIKKETMPQTPIVQSQSDKNSDKSLSLTIINNIEDLDSINDFDNLNNSNGKMSPRASSSIGEEIKLDNTGSTSKINNHFSNWRPSFLTNSSHPSTWNVEQVCRWLREKGLHSVTNHFIENDITGDVLIDLNLESLKELSVMSYGKRVHIMNAIRSLRDEYSLDSGRDNTNKINDEFYNNFEFSRSFPDVEMFSNINKSNTDISQKINEYEKQPMKGKGLTKKGSKIFSKLNFTNKNDKGGKGDKVSHSLSLRILNSPKKEKFRTQSNGGWDFLMEEEEMEKGLEKKSKKQSKKKQLKVITENANASSNSLKLDDYNESEYRNFYYEQPVEESINEEDDIINLGSPDYEGWLKKQGDKYKSWKNRYCILKGVNLFYLQSDKKQNPQIKGRINLTGYRVVPDENILQGKYGFKLIHDSERAYYFAHDDAYKMKCWMKAMMKATISRDIKTPVISSSNMSTVPLSEARRRVRSPIPFSDSDSTVLRSPTFPGSRSTSSPISTLNLSPHASISQSLAFPSSIKQTTYPLYT